MIRNTSSNSLDEGRGQFGDSGDCGKLASFTRFFGNNLTVGKAITNL